MKVFHCDLLQYVRYGNKENSNAKFRAHLQMKNLKFCQYEILLEMHYNNLNGLLRVMNCFVCKYYLKKTAFINARN